MKCSHCPLRDCSRPCRAETLGVYRYCELVDPDHPDYHPEYIPYLRDHVDESNANSPDPELRKQFEKQREAQKCLYLEREGCGCNYGICTIGRGKWLNGGTNMNDCIECIELGLNHPDPAP